MFQNVDLSPYTDFVERLLALLRGAIVLSSHHAI
jgi:hypothetical protein